MKEEEIHLGDIKRILLGQTPAAFLVEVFIRTLIIYLVAIFIMRFMGKRLNGTHSIIELSVMVMMGAIVAPAMQIPDRGILWGVEVLFVTLFLLRGLNWLGFKNKTIEKFVQGDVITIVSEGVLNKQAQQQTKITNQQVFEQLRIRGIYNLAKVKRMYMEGYGFFSVYTNEEPRPGLSLYPPIDEQILDHYPQASQSEKACSKCGMVQPNKVTACANCGNEVWTKAIL